MKIFGREPALILGFVGAVFAWAATLGFDWLSAGQATAAVTFITAVVIALTTRPVGPALFVGAVSAGAALAAEYGLNWSDAAVAAVGTIVLTAFALFGIRPQVTPKSDPVPIAPASGSIR